MIVKKEWSSAKISAMVLLCLFWVSLLPGKMARGEEKNVVPEAELKGHRVITVHAQEGITSPSVTIDRGTTVIWINYSRSMVDIQFTNKAVTLACGNPVRFAVDKNGAYTAEKIPLGEVASLCFVQPGEFDYVMKKVEAGAYSTKSEFKGRIVVK